MGFLCLPIRRRTMHKKKGKSTLSSARRDVASLEKATVPPLRVVGITLRAMDAKDSSRTPKILDQKLDKSSNHATTVAGSKKKAAPAAAARSVAGSQPRVARRAAPPSKPRTAPTPPRKAVVA